mgnify:CR=1 FL=1
MPPREPIKQTLKPSCHGQGLDSDLATAKFFFRFSDESLLKACRYSVQQVNCLHPTHPTSSLAFFLLALWLSWLFLSGYVNAFLVTELHKS